MNNTGKLKKTIIIISVVLFLFSLTQKCYCTAAQCADSIMAFLTGWFAIFTGGAGISWLANPLLLASWIALGKHIKASIFLSLLATIFALSFLLFDTIIANEGGDYQEITSRNAGYWIWACSCMCMLVGTFVIMLKDNNKNAAR